MHKNAGLLDVFARHKHHQSNWRSCFCFSRDSVKNQSLTFLAVLREYLNSTAILTVVERHLRTNRHQRISSGVPMCDVELPPTVSNSRFLSWLLEITSTSVPSRHRKSDSGERIAN